MIKHRLHLNYSHTPKSLITALPTEANTKASSGNITICLWLPTTVHRKLNPYQATQTPHDSFLFIVILHIDPLNAGSCKILFIGHRITIFIIGILPATIEVWAWIILRRL